MELLKHASEIADTMELIRVTDELYNKVVDPAFVKSTVILPRFLR